MIGKFDLRAVQEHWDKVAPEYDHANDKHKDTHDQRWIEAIKHFEIRPGIRILDVFCRTGDSIRYITSKNKNLEVIGIDLSLLMVKRAKSKYPKNDFIQASPYNLPFRDNSFDVILSLESLEHVPDPKRFIQELKRVLKSKGRLILSLPPPSAEIVSLIAEMLHLHHGEGPHKFWSPKLVKRLIREVGLNLIEHKGTLLIPVGPKFLKKFGEKIESKIQNTPLKELGIRQFYICEKI